jgi:hypothetical protein
MCIRCCNTYIQSSLNQGSAFDDRQWTNENGSQSRSGSVAENSKFTGPTETSKKFEGPSLGSDK